MPPGALVYETVVFDIAQMVIPLEKLRLYVGLKKNDVIAYHLHHCQMKSVSWAATDSLIFFSGSVFDDWGVVVKHYDKCKTLRVRLPIIAATFERTVVTEVLLGG